MRGYVTTRDSSFLQPYTTATTTVPAICSRLERLTADNSEQRRRLDTLQEIINTRMNILAKGLANFQNNGFVVTDEFRSRLDSGMGAMDRAKLYIAHFRGAEEKLMMTRKEKLLGFFNGARMLAIISVVVVLFALMYSIYTFNCAYHARIKADRIANEYQVELQELKDLEKFTSTGRIARTIAHEVRNPLTNILLATEQLKE